MAKLLDIGVDRGGPPDSRDGPQGIAALAPAQPFGDLRHLRIDLGMALAALARREPLALACGLTVQILRIATGRAPT